MKGKKGRKKREEGDFKRFFLVWNFGWVLGDGKHYGVAA
jgi:hypothetical protein